MLSPSERTIEAHLTLVPASAEVNMTWFVVLRGRSSVCTMRVTQTWCDRL
jgi:hypothetical protein